MRNRGFTLVELVVTLVILTILVSFAIPRFSVFLERSRQQEAIRILSAVHSSMRRYYYENDDWPDNLNVLDLDIEIPPLKYFEGLTIGNDSNGFFSNITRIQDNEWDYSIRINATGNFSYDIQTRAPGGLPQ